MRSSRGRWFVVSVGVGLAVIWIGACGASGSAGSAAVTRQWKTPPPDKLVDLSHPFDADTVYWPTATEGFQLKTVHHGPTEGGYFYAANTFCAPEHGGTHLDAPIHFAEGKESTDQIPLTRLIGPALVIDISDKARADPDALLEVADIEAFERAHGAIEPQSLVLVRTDWSASWPKRREYMGSDVPGDVEHLHFPGVSPEAARALVARRIGAVGIDTASIDHGPSRDFQTHRVLMEASTPAFENLNALARLPARGAFVVALPMDIRSGSGGPLRVVAFLP